MGKVVTLHPHVLLFLFLIPLFVTTPHLLTNQYYSDRVSDILFLQTGRPLLPEIVRSA
jgi:hypothetical protein